jgi:hypothetical protein
VEWSGARVGAEQAGRVIGGTAWAVVQLLILLGALVVTVVALVRAFRRR